MLNFKPTFSLSSFTFIKRLCSSSLVKFIPRYLIIFAEMVNGIDSLIFLSDFSFAETILHLLFQFGCLFFLSLALARTSNTMLNRSGESGFPCLVSDLKKIFFFNLSLLS